jgi:DNA mismatch repair protein MutL
MHSITQSISYSTKDGEDRADETENRREKATIDVEEEEQDQLAGGSGGGGGDAMHLLLEPVIVEMKRHQAELLEQRLPMLRELGIECERFGGRSFLVRSVPAGEGAEQLVGHMAELVEMAAEDSMDWRDHLLIGLACRAALRRGRELDEGEQRVLLRALGQVNVPAVCPHGSPIVLHYSRAFLIDKFDW